MQRPTNLSSDTKPVSPQRVQRHNIDHIDLSPSPVHTHPRHFQPGTLFDAQTFERIRSNVYNPPNQFKEEEGDDQDDDDDDDDDNHQQNLNDILHQARATEIEYLSQAIDLNRPIDATEIADILHQLIRTVPETTSSSSASIIPDISHRDARAEATTTMDTHSYPPINQTGRIADHDRPYADYGHLDRQTIAQEFQFNLQPPAVATNQKSIRLNAKSFAITSWTNVSKDLIMNEIKEEFGIENIQYICIGEEISELNHQRHVHIQIIFKEKVDRRKPFLDEITRTHCNYQVTHNDRAWNEYIRKDGNCIDFGTYQSTSARGEKQWPPSELSSAASVSSSDHRHRHHHQPTRAITTTRAQTEERRQHMRDIAKQALDLAETSVNDAMDFIRHSMPDKFIGQSTWYLTTFKYVHLRAQQEADRRGDIDKEYVWPLSFPDCTPQLREAINRWIRHHFSRAKRAKCLILIGPTGTGKTSFALSLPGRINYFKERWNLDEWNDYARYSVYDDVPWDEFKNLNYPNKKGLLTQNGKMNATDKYRGTQKINVRQPAIVLLNPEDAGSLTAAITEHSSIEQQQNAAYWKKRAFVYMMGPDEYFYRRIRTNTHANNEDTPVSSNSSIRTDEARIGELNEFDQMIQRYQQKHSK